MSFWDSLGLTVNDAGNEKSLSSSYSKCTQDKKSHLNSALYFVVLYIGMHIMFNSNITSKSCKA